MSSLPPPVPRGPVPPAKRAWYREPVVVILGAGSVLLAVVVGLNQLSPSKPNDDGPPRSNELCASLRDPLNDQLTKGDWERLTDWSESTLQRYVLDQCPDQYYRVD